MFSSQPRFIDPGISGGVINRFVDSIRQIRRSTAAPIRGSKTSVEILCLITLLVSHPSVFAEEAPNTAKEYAYENLQPQVGEVGIVLGRAFVKRADGVSESLKRGDKIRVLDQVSTLNNGHVHIRFLDDAYVSVRPNSVLKISRYEYDQARPQDSVVKFDLLEGVTRSISGKAARAARQRYRLNTPIAAIGVRGTDFVVNADSNSVRAKVFEGAIVLAPYSESCSQESLGPCLSDAIEVDPRASQMFAIEIGDSQAQLLPDGEFASEETARSELQLVSNEGSGTSTASAAPAADDADVAKQNEVLLEGATTAVVSSDAAASAAAPDPVIDSPPVVDPPQVVDLTPKTALTAADLEGRQLVWGRYSFAGLPTATDLIVLPYSEASEGRKTSVGNLEYGLFRTPATPALIDRNLGVVGFQLSAAQAVFNSETGVALMQVRGGSLEIDFNQSKFATELNLAHELTGQVDIVGSGGLYDGGFFRALSDTQTIRGAVSYDGAEAGYIFEKEINEGSVSGLTLWNSK